MVGDAIRLELVRVARLADREFGLKASEGAIPGPLL